MPRRCWTRKSAPRAMMARQCREMGGGGTGKSGGPLDAPQGVVTCPGGQQTATKTRHAHNTGWKCVCARRQCLGCALPAQCLITLSSQTGRRVLKHDDQAEYAAARARAATPAYAAVRWATRLPAPSVAQHKPAALMTESGDHPHVLASCGRGRSTRRGRLCQHRLTGSLWPAHDTPGAPCFPHQRPRVNAPVHDGRDAVMRPLAAPLQPAYTALLSSSVHHETH